MPRMQGFIENKDVPLATITKDGEWPLEPEKVRSMARGQTDPIIGWYDAAVFCVADGHLR